METPKSGSCPVIYLKKKSINDFEQTDHLIKLLCHPTSARITGLFFLCDIIWLIIQTGLTVSRVLLIWHVLFLSPFNSCGEDRAWRDARTNPRSVCNSRFPAQPGPAGRDLCHNADWQAQNRWLPGAWDDAVTPPLPGQPGKEAANH